MKKSSDKVANQYWQLPAFMVKYYTLQWVQCATVAQPVEQLTRNEQVVRSNRISSSKVKSPKSGFAPSFSGIFVCLEKSLLRGMWALITPISREVFWNANQKGPKIGKRPSCLSMERGTTKPTSWSQMTLPGWALRTGTDSSQKAVALSVSIC